MKQQNRKQKGLMGLAAMLVLAIAVIFGSEPLYRILDAANAVKPGTPAIALADGSYKAEEEGQDSSGYKGIVTMEVKDGAIAGLAWDSIDKDGNLKSKLSMEGTYLMTEDGPIWNDQAKALANYVISNQSVDGITLGEDGKTDTVAGVSIDVSGFVNLVSECMYQAMGMVKPVKPLTDGTYKAEEEAFDQSGYRGIVTMEVKNGYIAFVNWDSVDKDGTLKSKLSMEGLYNMTENGPKWHEQAQELADYVIANQSPDGLELDESGKTDTVASVSVDISGFVHLVKQCLNQAGGNEGLSTKAETALAR